jgi:hypothetical protein
MFDSSEKQLDVEIHEIQEEHVIVRFDFPRTQEAPRIGALILRQLGFGVVAIIGVSPNEAQARDIDVELMHNRFCTREHVWVKMQDGVKRWVSNARFQKQYHFTS